MLRWPHGGHGDCARAPAMARVGGPAAGRGARRRAICCVAAPPEALTLRSPRSGAVSKRTRGPMVSKRGKWSHSQSLPSVWIDGDAKRQIQYNSIQLNSIRVVWIDGRGPSYVDTFKNVTGRRTAGSPAGPILWLLPPIGVPRTRVARSSTVGPTAAYLFYNQP